MSRQCSAKKPDKGSVFREDRKEKQITMKENRAQERPVLCSFTFLWMGCAHTRLYVFLFSTFFRPRRARAQPSDEENAVFIEIRQPPPETMHSAQSAGTTCALIFSVSLDGLRLSPPGSVSFHRQKARGSRGFDAFFAGFTWSFHDFCTVYADFFTKITVYSTFSARFSTWLAKRNRPCKAVVLYRGGRFFF